MNRRLFIITGIVFFWFFAMTGLKADDDVPSLLENAKTALAEAETTLKTTDKENLKAAITKLSDAINALKETNKKLNQASNNAKQAKAVSELIKAREALEAVSRKVGFQTAVDSYADYAQGEIKAEMTSANNKAIKSTAEKATYQLEKYGSIHVSTPLLTSPTNDFYFDLKYGSSNYFTDAKSNRQGGASFFEQTVQSFAARAAGQYDPAAGAAYAAELQNYYAELNRYQKKQALGDEAAQAQLLADLMTAGTNQQQIAAAQKKFAEAFQAATNAPTFPSSQDTNLSSHFTNELSRPDVTNVFAHQQFADFQGLISNQAVTPTLDNRSAIIQAAGDHAVESIFRLLGDPARAKQFDNQRVFFGLVTVGVDPGWRTRKGFAAEAVVSSEIKYREARAEVVRKFAKRMKQDLPNELYLAVIKAYSLTTRDLGEDEQKNKTAVAAWANSQNVNVSVNTLKNIELFKTADLNSFLQDKNIPVEAKSVVQANQKKFEDLIPNPNDIFVPQLYTNSQNKLSANIQVISPLSDSQTLDLASSLRRQTELSLSLSVIMRMTGKSADAEAFEKFAKSRQFDIRTVTQLTSVNAFSSDGTFGFQVGPRMQAIGGAKKNNGPENIMERQSFPALLVLGLNNVDFQVKIEITTNTTGQATGIRILEPVLELTQTRRWHPLDRKGILGKDWYNPINWFHPRLGEDDRYDMAAKLQSAHDELEKAPDTDVTRGVLKKRVEQLQAQIMGGRSTVYFDPDAVVPPTKAAGNETEKIASISSVITDKINYADGFPFTLVYVGSNLDLVDTNKTTYLVGGDTSVKLQTKILNKGSAIVISGTQTAASKPLLVFQLNAKDSKGKEYPILTPGVQVVSKEKEPGISLSFDTTDNKKGTVKNTMSINLVKDLSLDQLKAVAEIIKAEIEKNKPVEKPSTAPASNTPAGKQPGGSTSGGGN